MEITLDYFWQIIKDLRVLGDQADKITIDGQTPMGR